MSHNDNSGFRLIVGLGTSLVTFLRGFRVYHESRVVGDTPRLSYAACL